MANNAFTSRQKSEESDNLSPAIKSAILQLQKAFPEQAIVALYWNASYIAIPLVVSVDLPTRGPVGNVDIRKKEPVYLLLHRQRYPYEAPLVYSNRCDFPASQLAHLNPTRPGKAARFCLHRGNFDSWFAEHTIVDVVKRVQGWLRDAARDRLIRREDGFEETRVVEALGYAIYDPEDLRQHVYQVWRQNDGSGGFCFLWYKLLNNPHKDPLIGGDTFAVRLFGLLPTADLITQALDLSQQINELHTEKATFDRLLFGFLAWPPKEDVCTTYFGALPSNIGDFQSWAQNLGVPATEALQDYQTNGLQLFGGVPVTVVVPRPQRMIRTHSRLELLNFVVGAGGEYAPKDGNWNPGTRVFSMGHRAPLTLRRARDISSQPPDLDLGGLLFLGCGAIGSKLILHLARSGQGKMTLVDYDELSPHNLVRHGLLHQSLGRSKAEGLRDAIEGVFYADKTVKIDTVKSSALDILLGEQGQLLDQHTWLIDATASPMMLNILTHAVLPPSLSCCRCEIADDGRLGLMSIEGTGRNPRLDDLQVLAFDMALEVPALSSWLQANQQQREQPVGSILEDINIGISCSSETMRLADEVVSLHTATFATGFRRYATENRQYDAGRLQISLYNEADKVPVIVEQADIRPMTTVAARNDPTWEVRLRPGHQEEMQELLHRAKPRETGGLLIGQVNFKRKIIYVTRVLPAPPDSKSSPYAFVRGVQDVPEKVCEIEGLTGGMLGYIGEWHTHPVGGPELSAKDKATVAKIQRNLAKIPLPTHVMVVTSRGLYPHIFSPI